MAEFLNKEGVDLLLQNINNHINTKASNYLPLSDAPKNVSDLVNDANYSPVVSIELSINLEDSITAGTMLTNVFTADQITAIGNAYGKGIVRLIDTANTYFDAIFVYYEGVNSWTISGRYIMTDIMANANGQMNFLENTVDTDNFISKSPDYTSYNIAMAEGLYDSMNGNPWALPGSDFSDDVGLESTLASRKDTPAIYKSTNTTSPLTTELISYSAPAAQEPGNIIGILFQDDFQSQQDQLIDIDGSEWDCPKYFTAKTGDVILFMFDNDNLHPVKVANSNWAEGLKTTRYINGLGFNGGSNIHNYTTCGTAAATAAKTASITNYSLLTGSQVRIKFTSANTASAPTLNITSTGAKSMRYKGTVITGSNFTFDTTKIYTFTYTGTYYDLEGDWEMPTTHYVTCSNAGNTTAKTVTLNGFSLVIGARISVKFDNDQSVALSTGLTLNVNGTGAKVMYYKDAVMDGNSISFKAGVIYDFIYDGTYWRLQGEWDDIFSQSGSSVDATIDGIAFDGTTDITRLALCGTAASTVAKTATVEGLEIATGARISLYMQNGHTATTMTLNINSTGAKTVLYGGQNYLPALGIGTYDFVYTADGIWDLVTNKTKSMRQVGGATATGALQTNQFIRYSTALTSLNVSATPTTVPNAEYSCEFTTASTGCTFTYPSAWKWVNGTAPTIEADKTYQLSVINNCAVIASFS